MGNLKARIQPEYEYDGVPFESHVILHETSRPRYAELPRGSGVHSWQYVHVKRWIDVVGSLILIVFSLIPGIVIAALIALTSKGSVFYRETRIGRGGRPFRIWKFRSMCHEAEWREVIKTGSCDGGLLHWRVHKNTRDPRITPIGRFLRRWSLDELPQLLNVLRGDMSLIGPRPVVAAEMPFYGHLQCFYLAVTPGLSGKWQVSGRSNVSFDIRANLDAVYVRDWSLQADFFIIVRTIPAVLGRVGAR